MKKITLIIALSLFSYSAIAQVLDQPANWPNNNWTITGSYLTDATIFEADPTISANFAYDDDDAGSGHSDNIAAESAVIDLTAAYNAGETWLFVNTSYVFRSLGELLKIQYWDADASAWIDLGTQLPGTSNAPNNNYCSGNHVNLTSEQLDISTFTTTQLSGFRYRLSYDDTGIFGWGFCFNSPTINSQVPPACPNITGLYSSNINTNSADIYWGIGDAETSWEIVIQSQGIGLPTGSGVATSLNNPYNATGLTENTAYEVYVRGFCGGTDYSNWIGPVNFTTLLPSRVNFIQQPISTSGGYDLTVVDMNGDFLDDIVSVSSTKVYIYHQLNGGGFDPEVDLSTPAADFLPGWSMAAADFDGNGYTDLLYGSGSGVTFMKANSTGTSFTELSGPQYVFSQRSNFADINNDGDLDAFVCHDVEPNVYYINDGSGNLTFNQGGLGDYASGGNYGSIWIDYDNDGDLDMFIAKCGGETARRMNQMLTNNGDGTFTENAAAIGIADPMQTWSSSWGDYDNDGDMDLFVGASSGTHKLMENNGNGTFSDATGASGVLSVSTTGHENVSYDIDNDGNLDIIGNGVIFYGNGDLTFSEFDSNQLNYKNGSFGDLNNDGFIDAYYNGTIYYNNTTSNNWITINTVGTTSNINGIGARVEIETDSGTQIRDVRSGEGFEFMSTLNTHLGIGQETSIISLTIRWPSGLIDQILSPAINQAITVTEGENPLSVQDVELLDISIHPNPVKDILNISTSINLSNRIATVFDINGKRVLNEMVANNSLDVSKLQSGIYILRLESNGKLINRKFIKQ